MTFEDERRKREQRNMNIEAQHEGNERAQKEQEAKAAKYAAEHPDKQNIKNFDVAKLAARVAELEKKKGQ